MFRLCPEIAIRQLSEIRGTSTCLGLAAPMAPPQGHPLIWIEYWITRVPKARLIWRPEFVCKILCFCCTSCVLLQCICWAQTPKRSPLAAHRPTHDAVRQVHRQAQINTSSQCKNQTAQLVGPTSLPSKSKVTLASGLLVQALSLGKRCSPSRCQSPSNLQPSALPQKRNCQGKSGSCSLGSEVWLLDSRRADACDLGPAWTISVELT